MVVVVVVVVGIGVGLEVTCVFFFSGLIEDRHTPKDAGDARARAPLFDVFLFAGCFKSLGRGTRND